MKHNITIAVAALAVTAGACNGRAGTDRANQVTAIGCVQSAEQGLGSTKGKNDIDKFMLTNANVASIPSSSSSSTSDTTGSDRARGDQARGDAAPAPAPAPTGSMFLLDGKTSELRDQLNHQVEITGHLDRDRDSARAANGAASATSDRRQELHVDSVRMIAANCNQ